MAVARRAGQLAPRGRVSAAAMRDLESSPAVLTEVDRLVASPMADRMRARAPRSDGPGPHAADTITSQPDPDRPGFRVGWPTDGFVLGFAELGTVHQPPRPFARPTAAEFLR